MEKCRETGCVLNVFTKGYNFKDTTVTKCRGSVKGTKCGKSVTFGTCLQQWFGLGILDDISRQAKTRQMSGVVHSPVQSDEERMRAEQKGRSDRAIALIAESVTKTLDQAEALTQQVQTLKENAKRLQVTLAEAVRRRDADENVDVIDVDLMIVEKAPASKTVAHNPVPQALSPAPLGM